MSESGGIGRGSLALLKTQAGAVSFRFKHSQILMARIFIFLVMAIILGACSSDRPPNVVIILADDQGWGDLSMNGNSSVETSNIDGIGQRGALFDRFYVSPVCSPTRAELLTGRYHVRSNVFGTSAGAERLDADETTIGDIFKASGYATGIFGKWHNGQQAPYHPNSRGFDDFYGFPSGHWGHYFDAPLEHNNAPVQSTGYLPDDLTDQALEFMSSHRDNPFLAYIPYNTPHSPMQVPDMWWDQVPHVLQSPTRPEMEDTVHTRAALAMTLNIDWNVGRILDHLEALDLTEETIVLYFSDNGPNGARWNGGMKGRKGSTDEGGVRSVMVMQWPGMIPAGLEILPIAGAIDLLPTLAELADVELGSALALDGISLAGHLTGDEAISPERYIFSHWRGRTSVRSQTHRLSHEGWLFDMMEDPDQTRDVSENEPDIAHAMLTARTRWEEATLPDSFVTRPFTVGHSDLVVTHLPARDARSAGGIVRSNRYPNDSHFTNWTDTTGRIAWDVNVLSSATYQPTLYYTSPDGSEGAAVELRMGEYNSIARIDSAHNPPLMGMVEDRVLRIESYVKPFRPLEMAPIHLETGEGRLILRALEMPGPSVMDFRLLTLERLE